MPVTRSWSNARQGQRGLSLIELMVGITIGMIVTAGAIVMMVNQVAEHRRLILETQVQQDLRAAADLMLRDLRRAGFWATAEQGSSAPDSALPADGRPNPYTAIVIPDAQHITYGYSNANNNSAATVLENNSLDGNETFGFQVEAGILKFNFGGSWQPLTDPGTLTITDLAITPTVQEIGLGGYCNKLCGAGGPACPVQQIRRINISLTGRAAHDSRVVRTISISSRIRNDAIVGSCP